SGATNDGMVRFWDAETGQKGRRLPVRGNHIQSVAFSPDGLRVVFAGGLMNQPEAALIHDLATGALLIMPAKVGQNANGVAFSPDGRQVVIASGEVNEIVDGGPRPTGWVKVYDAQTGQFLFTLEEGENPACAASFSPDGHSIIAVIGSR